ncbi:hypothetical protein CIPAW_05G157100 [Carya illinoinensis]|uniref:GRF-type domain-containing protein n=1 Tax=Carya illinoinensis TaxID=32201 RepID=A0A8T1QIX3_CARIL|nr:hypothetical protein CIPAW_05G157100 [Carya illinoinensis]
MASSQSSSSVINCDEIESPSCWCGLKSPLKISHTYKNPGRKFYACPKYYTLEPRCQFFIWEDIFQSVVRENVNKTRENELRKRKDALLLREYEAQIEKDKLVEREQMLNKQEGELGRRIVENRIGRIFLCLFWIVSLVIVWF